MLKISKKFNTKTLHAKHDFDFDRDDDFEKLNLLISKVDFIIKIHVMQTNHIATTNRINYDNDVNLSSKFTNELLTNYLQIYLF